MPNSSLFSPRLLPNTQSVFLEYKHETHNNLSPERERESEQSMAYGIILSNKIRFSCLRID